METSAIARLTEREKDCLRRWLDHSTAKEIALDLGISPHAVEKRLKMARAKLGVSSSLEAARLLAQFEGYQRAGAQATDLAPASDPIDQPASRSTIIGVLAMTLVLVAATVALFSQPVGESAMAPATEPVVSPPVTDEGPATGATIKMGMGDLGNVPASPERARRYVRQMFDREDRDRSGYIELAEGPSRLEVAEPREEGSTPLPYSEARIVKVLEGDPARREYMLGSDRDGDNRISFDEYAAARVPYYQQHGIPLMPADWTPAP